MFEVQWFLWEDLTAVEFGLFNLDKLELHKHLKQSSKGKVKTLKLNMGTVMNDGGIQHQYQSINQILFV